MRTELRKLQRELGITFIHVTHGQDEALALADEIVVMNNAVIEQAGPARDVYNVPLHGIRRRFIQAATMSIRARAGPLRRPRRLSPPLARRDRGRCHRHRIPGAPMSPSPRASPAIRKSWP